MPIKIKTFIPVRSVDIPLGGGANCVPVLSNIPAKTVARFGALITGNAVFRSS